MTRLRLSIRSAIFYWRSHLSVLVGTAIAGAVLVGAMVAGDSVKYSLRQTALLRLGSIHYAMSTPGRFFRQDLADRLEDRTRTRMAPVLLLRGIAMTRADGVSGNMRSGGPVRGDGDSEGSGDFRQINNVQVIGIDDRFLALAGGNGTAPGDDEIAINGKLAAALGIKAGDRLSVRIGKPSLFPKDAPLSSQDDDDTSRRSLIVSKIVPDDELGRLGLAANQVVPYNAFVGLKWLQQVADVPGRVNLLLAGASETAPSRDLNEAIGNVWRIEDAGLILREMSGQGLIQLESDRIFMDPAVSSAALRAGIPDCESTSVGALTYLVNSISMVTNGVTTATPYSFVIALSPSTNRRLGPVSHDMADDEIIVNRWLANQLSARTGDTVRVAYYELISVNRYIEKSRLFRVLRILEMDDIAGEKDLGPKFPGLADADRCAEWDIGMPLDKDKIRDKPNEAYWDAYRATPKAFITLKAGQAMWANRFGNLSAVRYAASPSGRDAIAERLRRRLDPADAGLSFVPVRAQALKAADDAMDFGQLFLGMSFFLIVAGLMLTGLLFAFGVQQRAAEMGVLFAVGYRPTHVRRLLMTESCFVAGLGAVAGALLGMLYSKLLIFGLANYWQGAVASSAIWYHADPVAVLKGTLACFVCAIMSMAVAMRWQSARPARELLSGDASLSSVLGPGERSHGGRISILSMAGAVAAIGIIANAVMTGRSNAVPAFFAAGALLLLSGLGLIRQVLIHLERTGAALTVTVLGIRNACRRRARSVTVAALLACGCFMVFAVSSMREDVSTDSARRSSGTGGFALFGESTLPLRVDLNSVEGRKKLRLTGVQSIKNAGIVSLKVRDGDDASCLNLNRAQTPRLIGVDPGNFSRRGAFARRESGAQLWGMLDEALPDGVVPGLVGDENTAMWGLKKKAGRQNGDVMIFRDEHGAEFKVKLVGNLPMRLSVFQGSVLIPAGAFSAKYPSESGYRMFLFDVQAGAENAAKAVLSGRLGKYGFNVVSTVDRLREFYAVESTYMTMFLVLGGLGLLLGSAGMGIVVMRNIFERRDELCLLKAVGYSNAQLRAVVLTEHLLILAMGMTLGILSSLAAMWPALSAPGVRLPLITMFLLFGGIVLFNLVWMMVATRLALRSHDHHTMRIE